MTRLGGVLVRWVLLPALLFAATFLAWWTYRTTLTLQQLGDASLIGTTRLLAREKADRVDQLIQNGESATAHLVNPDDLEALITRWNESPDRIAPTVRSVMVLDQGFHVLRHPSRGGETEARRFRALFLERLLPELHLPSERPGAHSHLHATVNGESVLLGYLTFEVPGSARRFYVVVEADLAYVRETVLRNLFDDADAAGRFNVVDEDGRLVFGKAMSGAGDFVVFARFQTTLYKWRLSVTPDAAPALVRARGRRRRLLETVLVSVSLTILLAGVFFLSYAARNERRLNALKSDFIATVSHELKTPLSLIRMFGEMLASKRVPTEAKREQYLDIIVRESERLTALIENVLDFAKLERGKAAYEFSPGNLAEIAGRGVEIFRQRLDRERPELVLVTDPATPEARLDERAVQLLLFNLLDNAVKYAPEGERITVRVGPSAAGVTLQVEDQGPGIDEDDAKRVFERFYRGKSARASAARGSGIGLALVKHIATAHGGDVEVTRAEGGGAVFAVSFPATGRPSRGPPPPAPLLPQTAGD